MSNSLLSFTQMSITAPVVGVAFEKVANTVNSVFAMPVWGVPVTTFGAAAFGAGLSLFFGDPVPNQRDLWGQLAAACLFGTASAVLIAGAMNLGWAKEHMSLFALVNAACIRWFLPPLIERGRLIIKEYKLSLKLKKPSSGDET